MLEKVIGHPIVAHALRAIARYNNRLGNQFAAAITYFSVLAMVPILMFAFALTGMTLTVLRPDLLDTLMAMIAEQLQGAPGNTSDSIIAVIDNALRNWRTIGLVGLLSFLYAGSGWVGNLKAAVRSQFRLDLEVRAKKENIVLKTLTNTGVLILLILAVGITFGLATAATSLTGTIVEALGLQALPGISLGTRVIGVLVSLLASWLLFLFLFRVLPASRPGTRPWMVGALIGAVMLVILQYLTGILMGAFLGNPAAALFGPIIALMLFFNLFARLILYVGAWIATSRQPAIARKWNDADAPLQGSDDVETVPGHWAAAEVEHRRQRIEKADAKVQRTEALNKVKGALPGLKPTPKASREAMEEAVRTRLEIEAEVAAERTPVSASRYDGVDGRRYFTDENEPVDHSVAVRRARTSLTGGYLSGLVTGTGIGAVIVGLLARRNRS